jgi:hypothetical protein
VGNHVGRRLRSTAKTIKNAGFRNRKPAEGGGSRQRSLWIASMGSMSSTASAWAFDICSAYRAQEYAFAVSGSWRSGGNLADRRPSEIAMRYPLLLSNS